MAAACCSRDPAGSDGAPGPRRAVRKDPSWPAAAARFPSVADGAAGAHIRPAATSARRGAGAGPKGVIGDPAGGRRAGVRARHIAGRGCRRGSDHRRGAVGSGVAKRICAGRRRSPIRRPKRLLAAPAGRGWAVCTRKSLYLVPVAFCHDAIMVGSVSRGKDGTAEQSGQGIPRFGHAVKARMQNLRKILEKTFVADVEHHAAIGSTNDRAIAVRGLPSGEASPPDRRRPPDCRSRARFQPLVDRPGESGLQPADRAGVDGFAAGCLPRCRRRFGRLGLAGGRGGGCRGPGPAAAAGP